MEKDKKYMLELSFDELMEIHQLVVNAKIKEEEILTNMLKSNSKMFFAVYDEDLINDSRSKISNWENLYKKLIDTKPI